MINFKCQIKGQTKVISGADILFIMGYPKKLTPKPLSPPHIKGFFSYLNKIVVLEDMHSQPTSTIVVLNNHHSYAVEEVISTTEEEPNFNFITDYQNI